MTERPQSIHERIMTARSQTGDARSAFADKLKPARPRWLWPLIYGAACVVLIGGIGIGFYELPVAAESIAQGATKKATTPQPIAKQLAPKQPQSTGSAAAAPPDPFLEHAKQAGANTCAATYAGLGKALTDGTQFMVQTQTAKTDADRHALQGVVGMTFGPSRDGNSTGAAAGFVFAAPTGKGCEGNMVRIVPFAQSCQTAASFLPSGSQPQQPLSGLPVYTLSSGGQAMLIPTGNGCVIVSVIRSGA